MKALRDFARILGIVLLAIPQTGPAEVVRDTAAAASEAEKAAASEQKARNYFTDLEVVDQNGKRLRFYSDVLKDRVVLINFIFTSCDFACPMLVQRLNKTRSLLVDAVRDDVWFVSISIDPETDTPEVLRDYRARFRANWTFLTDAEHDIITLRRKLGLYVEEIQDGSNNHNVSMIIGNQATGRWMKRSPFENPHVLADQLGNWLAGWRSPPRGEDYAHAPELREMGPSDVHLRILAVSGEHNINHAALADTVIGSTWIWPCSSNSALSGPCPMRATISTLSSLRSRSIDIV